MISRMPSVLAAGLCMLGAIVLPSAVTAQPVVDSYVNFAWRDLTQPECVARASSSVDQAISAFALTATQTQVDDWHVLGDADDLVFWVFCIADAGSDGVINPNAARLLVHVNVNTIRPDFGAELRDYLAECMAGACPAAAAAKGATTIGWSESPQEFRGRTGERFDYVCAPLGDRTMGPIWGTDIYTDDSAICTAASHAGVITAAGGPVTIEVLPGQDAYTASERNGVLSGSWGSYQGSFRVVATAAK